MEDPHSDVDIQSDDEYEDGRSAVCHSRLHGKHDPKDAHAVYLSEIPWDGDHTYPLANTRDKIGKKE